MRAFSREHRDRYGREMVEGFERELSKLQTQRGWWHALPYALAACLDVVAAGLGERRRKTRDQGRTGGGHLKLGEDSPQQERMPREELSGVSGGGWGDALAADGRFALRQFRRRWGTTITMLAILSLGMSISILLFSFVHSYAVLPPPVLPRADDLVRIRGHQTYFGLASRNFADDEFGEYRRLSDQFSDVVGWADATVTLDVPDYDVGSAAIASFVTENYFAILGVQPILGPGLPTILSGNQTTDAVAVIGHRVWDQFFGRNPDVIGRTLNVNSVSITIVGVAPSRFVGAGGAFSRLQIWLPLSNRYLVLPNSSAEALTFRAVAQLRPGVSLDGATAAVEVVAARAAESAARAAESIGGAVAGEASAQVVPLLSLNIDPNFEQDVRRLVFLLGGLGLLVLLVTCTNLSALMMGLAMARRQEIVIRLSLGAARSRVIRQLLTESALLALVAGAAALGIVWLVLRAVATIFPQIPVEMGVTWLATTFTFTTSLAVGVLFGLAPALHATRLAVADALRDSTAAIAGSRLRLQRALVVAQIAFIQPLVLGLVAVLLIVMGDFQPVSRNEFAEQLISLRLTSATRTAGRANIGSESVQQLKAEMRRLRARVESAPGVAAAVIDSEPTAGPGSYFVYPEDRVEGGLQESFRVSGNTAAPGFFSAIGIPLLRGREFTTTDVNVSFLGDNAVAVPIIIGTNLARRLWPGADPLGRRLQAVVDPGVDSAPLVVTGVVADPEAGRGDLRERQQVYLAPDTAVAFSALLIRTTSDAQPLISTIRRIAQEEVPGMIADIRTVASIEDESRRIFGRITAGLAGSGLLTLLLSAIGLYAVVAFGVGQRTREIAVRMAVGAPARRVAARFLVDGLRLSVFGLAFGLPLSVVGLRVYNAISVLETEFLPVSIPQATVLTVFAVIVTAAAASFVPARRAASVDPARILHRV